MTLDDRRGRRHPTALRAVFLVATLVSAALGVGCKQESGAPGREEAAPLPRGAVLVPETPAVRAAPPQPLPALPPGQAMPISFASLARIADPAVATVKSRFERVFRGRRRVVGEGLGTAFLYDPEGYMLTNNHVIEDAAEVTVGFLDGKELPAKVIGRDKHTDIAVLKVEGKGFSTLPLGNSDAIEVGDWVVAIGNPFGLSHTVSAGILSAKGRTLDDVKDLDPSGYYDFLQTDASINPGNSGGPLINLAGQVVGINAAIRANANNIGFAIPINMVKQLLPMLLHDGKISRSALGVRVDSLSAAQADLLKRPDRKGAWVKEVVPGGPADRAGIAPNDIIVGFDGTPVASPNELRWLASIGGVNKSATIRIARQDRVFEVKVTLGALDLPDEPEEQPR